MPSKRLLIVEYMQGLKTMMMMNRSAIALDECLSYKWSNDGSAVVHQGSLNVEDPASAGVNHGDRVIADALAYKMARQLGLSELKNRPEQSKEIKVGSIAWRAEIRRQRESELSEY